MDPFWILLYMASLTVLLLWLFYQKVDRYPKGPRPYPFVGNLLSLNFRKLHENFKRYSEEFGGIFTIWLPKPYAVITDYKLLKDAFIKDGKIFRNC
ncbi:hypothetical protein COOONC_18711, partial [Cooperia oncophora]